MRRAALNAQGERLSRMSSCELAREVAATYDRYAGVPACRVNWALYSRNDLVELVHAAGPAVLQRVTSRILQHVRETQYGLPDIVMWRPLPCPRCALAFRPILLPHLALSTAAAGAESGGAGLTDASRQLAGRLVMRVRRELAGAPVRPAGGAGSARAVGDGGRRRRQGRGACASVVRASTLSPLGGRLDPVFDGGADDRRADPVLRPPGTMGLRRFRQKELKPAA
jgi:hypothetical protein